MNKKIVDKVDEDGFIEAIDKVSKKYNISDEEAGQYLLSLGPKKLTKMGLMENAKSWRVGYTKPDISSRKAKNRKKNKMSKEAKRKNR